MQIQSVIKTVKNLKPLTDINHAGIGFSSNKLSNGYNCDRWQAKQNTQSKPMGSNV